MRGKLGLGVLLAAVLAVAAPVFAQAPAPAEGKPGGVLRLVLREDLPQGFAIHESATNSVTWPAMPLLVGYWPTTTPKRSRTRGWR